MNEARGNDASRCPCPGKRVMDVVTIIGLVLLFPLLLLNAVFLLEVAVGLRGTATKTASSGAAYGRATIVIPAHDEASVIGDTLSALVPVATEADFPILVVADNCRDETARIARSFGLQVIERHEHDRRGKGFALSFARDWLSKAPPAAVIVLDADCRTDLQSLRNLASSSLTLGRPAQAIYLLLPSLTSAAMVQVSNFAFLLKNKFRQRGLQRLTGEVLLTGSGMCLPWPMFAEADLATSSIVEDLRLGIELSARGTPPLLVEDSFVWSPHAPLDATIGQRKRWEGGFLSMARLTAPGLLRQGLRRADAGTILRGLDLFIPPLALLGLLNLGALLLLLSLAVAGVMGWLPLLVLAGVSGAAGVALIAAWWLEGRAFLSAGALARLPLYVLWKVPMYVGLVRKGAPMEWRRTARESEKAD